MSDQPLALGAILYPGFGTLPELDNPRMWAFLAERSKNARVTVTRINRQGTEKKMVREISTCTGIPKILVCITLDDVPLHKEQRQ